MRPGSCPSSSSASDGNCAGGAGGGGGAGASAPGANNNSCRLSARANNGVSLGLIERAWSKANRRHSIARITRQGMDLLRILDPEVENVRKELLGRLTAKQLKQLSVAFDAVIS